MVQNVVHLDLLALAELREVMEEEFDILLDTFLVDSADRVLQLESAVKSGNADDVSRAAHAFKGSCINVGAKVLAELCMNVEAKGRSGDLEGVDELVASIREAFAEVSVLLKEQMG